jgi:hypothetical protein
MLYLWSWTNTNVNAACCYKVVLEDVARVCCFADADEVSEAIAELDNRVVYFEDVAYLWVPSFIHHQTSSELYLRGVARCLETEVPSLIALQVLRHNAKLGITIPYKWAYRPDTVLPDTVSTNTTQEQHNTTQLPSASRKRSRPRVLTPEQDADKQAAIDHFFGRLQRHTHLKAPPFPGGQAARFFSQRLKAGDTLEGLKACTDRFFDRWIKPQSAAGFSHYQRVYAGLAKAVMEADDAQVSTK